MDFSGDLYGQELRVELRHRLREIRPYESAAALIAQMRADEVAGRALLRTHTP
jgi:riboflavin kinase/FMN adenylyltransferase